jgi:protease-4
MYRQSELRSTPMKGSKTWVAVLFMVFALFAFVMVVYVLSFLLDTDKEFSGLASILEHGNKIGVITIEGQITSSDETLKQFRKFAKKSSIKAIVVRINSPGGAVAPAQEIYREIGEVRKKKPVVVSMETVGASAAYYLASNSDRIVCSSGTITGSIGVIMLLTEIHRVIDKLGVSVNIIKAGKYKDTGIGVRPLREDERTLLEEFAKEIHEQFIKDVAAGRKGKISIDNLRTIADGRFFSGDKAKEMGLVDTIGNFYDAVRIAAQLGGIKTEPELIYPKKKWDSYLELFMESALNAVSRFTERSQVVQGAPVLR